MPRPSKSGPDLTSPLRLLVAGVLAYVVWQAAKPKLTGSETAALPAPPPGA